VFDSLLRHQCPGSPTGRGASLRRKAVGVRILLGTPLCTCSPIGRGPGLNPGQCGFEACHVHAHVRKQAKRPASKAGGWRFDFSHGHQTNAPFAKWPKASVLQTDISEVRILDGVPIPGCPAEFSPRCRLREPSAAWHCPGRAAPGAFIASQSERRGPRPITEWQVVRLHRLAPTNGDRV
jgi:hypothetical protein